MSRTDEELVASFQAGNEHSFNELIKRHQPKVNGIVRRYARSSNDHDDIVQDVILRAYKGLAKFRQDSSFSTWIHRVTVNASINHLAAMKRRIPAQDIDASMFDHDTNAILNNSAMISSEDPLEEVSANQLVKRLIEALDEMPDRISMAFKLREFEQMPYDQIADIMNIPVGTVRSRIFRARRRMEAARDEL